MKSGNQKGDAYLWSCSGDTWCSSGEKNATCCNSWPSFGIPATIPPYVTLPAATVTVTSIPRKIYLPNIAKSTLILAVTLGILITGIIIFAGFLVWEKRRMVRRGGNFHDTEPLHSYSHESVYQLIPVRPESEHEVQGDDPIIDRSSTSQGDLPPAP
jgi:hypothetical protein